MKGESAPPASPEAPRNDRLDGPSGVPVSRGLIGIQGEAHPLQHPVRNVPCGEEVGLKHQADPHGVPSGGGGVDGRPEGVLQRKGRREVPWTEARAHRRSGTGGASGSVLREQWPLPGCV